MVLLETRRGEQHFAFEHNREYQLVQFKFLDAVESMDPNNLVVGSPLGMPKVMTSNLPALKLQQFVPSRF